MNESAPSPIHTLLICSVGGSPEPIATALKHIKPARALLWHSAETRSCAITAIQKSDFVEHNADFKIVSQPQDFHQCIIDARSLTPLASEWNKRSPHHRVVVNFTGGTKAMSAALVLVAHRWDCQFLYIAGDQRTKEGVGIVVSGSEKPVQLHNPYDTLGYQSLADAVHLFNHRQSAAASQICESFVKQPNLDPAVKRQLTAVQYLANAYSHWDAFQHQKAVASFDRVLQAANDLDAALPHHDLNLILKRHRELCDSLAMSHGSPSQYLILDLFANADRRAADQRYDDAIARLYRTTEALAQLALSKDHHINASNTRLDQLPQNLQERWRSRANADTLIKLALQDAYVVLHEFQHPLGLKFRQLKLHEPTSPLTARNQSILAHGFSPATEKMFRTLRDPLFQLANAPDLQPFTFPQL